MSLHTADPDINWKPSILRKVSVMTRHPWLMLGAGVLIGAIVYPALRGLPLLNRLPTVGG